MKHTRQRSNMKANGGREKRKRLIISDVILRTKIPRVRDGFAYGRSFSKSRYYEYSIVTIVNYLPVGETRTARPNLLKFKHGATLVDDYVTDDDFCRFLIRSTS